MRLLVLCSLWFGALVRTDVFIEEFPNNSTTHWLQSETVKAQDQVLKFDGNWKIEPPVVLPAFNNDYGLVVKSKARHHAISRILPKPIDPRNKTFVVQYEVKFQDLLECGGGYLKLLTQQEQKFDPKKFDDKTPYSIMFGPDVCGSMNKIHFILRHKNPITGEFEEKHLKSSLKAEISKCSSLYTLIIKPNNDFSIHINQKPVFSGNLLVDMTPPINPPREIEDENDVKPLTWVDEEEIPDPSAVKPADWDESAPMFIDDPDATKPHDWLENEPLSIDDPNAVKPSTWDDVQDGRWSPSQVPNPKCSQVSGCGTWKPPKIKNPNYKGKWSPAMIKNPAYVGPWRRRTVPNPHYFQDMHPHNFEPISAIGFELWTMQKDILFDNIFIGDSEDEALEYGQRTWKVKYDLEKVLESRLTIEGDPLGSACLGSWTARLVEIVDDLRTDPQMGLKKHINILGMVGLLVLLLIVLAKRAVASKKEEPVETQSAEPTKSRSKIIKDD